MELAGSTAVKSTEQVLYGAEVDTIGAYPVHRSLCSDRSSVWIVRMAVISQQKSKKRCGDYADPGGYLDLLDASGGGDGW
jgi:hypothetical protein